MNIILDKEKEVNTKTLKKLKDIEKTLYNILNKLNLVLKGK